MPIPEEPEDTEPLEITPGFTPAGEPQPIPDVDEPLVKADPMKPFRDPASVRGQEILGPYDAWIAEVVQVNYASGDSLYGDFQRVSVMRCDVWYKGNNEPTAVDAPQVLSQPTPTVVEAMPHPVMHDQQKYHVSVGDIVTVVEGRDERRWFFFDDQPFFAKVIDNDDSDADNTEKWTAYAGTETLKVRRYGLSEDPDSGDYGDHGVTLSELQTAASAYVEYAGVRPICPAGVHHGYRVGDTMLVTRRGRYMACEPAAQQFVGEITQTSPQAGGTFCNYEVKEQDGAASYTNGNTYTLAFTDRTRAVAGQSGYSARLIVAYNLAESAGGNGLSVGDVVVVKMFSSAVSTREPYYIIERVIDTNGNGGGGKSAIIKIRGQHRAAFCVEAPQVWLMDLMCAPLDGSCMRIEIDPIFLAACHPGSIQVYGQACDRLTPHPIAARVEDRHVILETTHAPIDPIIVRLTLMGLRGDCFTPRFPMRTPTQAEFNRDWWRQANGLG